MSSFQSTGSSVGLSTVEWRLILNFPVPAYRVSNTGIVQSCWMRVGRGKGMGRGARYVLGDKWVTLKPNVLRNGRLMITLCRDGHLYYRYLHRLVLEAFIGPCPPGMEACHYPDPNPANCNLENLRWDTCAENVQDAIEHGTHVTVHQCGEDNPCSKLTESDVREIRTRVAEGESRAVVAEDFDLHVNYVSMIVRRERWKHVI